MTVETVIALATAMVILAVIPGPSVLTIIAGSLSSGFMSTLPLIAGVVLGDVIFLLLSFLGLSIVVNLLGDLFIIVKFLGAIHLFWLGGRLITKDSNDREQDRVLGTHSWQNFLLGLTLALSNPKVILFYISFFPAIIDIPLASVFDMVYVLFVVESVLLLVLLSYAYCSMMARGFIKNQRSIKILNICSGSLLIGGGVCVLIKR